MGTEELRGDTPLVTSVRVEEGPGHDRVSVWNRGGLAGVLTVKKGDGQALGKLLTCGFSWEQIRRMHEVTMDVADGDIGPVLLDTTAAWARAQGW